MEFIGCLQMQYFHVSPSFTFDLSDHKVLWNLLMGSHSEFSSQISIIRYSSKSAGVHVEIFACYAARLARQSGAPKLFHGMSFWMGSGYKGTGLSPQQLAELLIDAGGHVLQESPAQVAGDHALNCNLDLNAIHRKMAQQYSCMMVQNARQLEINSASDY